MDRWIGLGLVLGAFAGGCAAATPDDSPVGMAGSMAVFSGAGTIGSGGTVGMPGGGGAAGFTSSAGSFAMPPGSGTGGNPGDVTGPVSGSGGMGGDLTAGTTAPGAGAGGTGEVAGSAAPPTEYIPPCLTSPSQLITMGDSWVNYTYQLNPELEDRATSDGALSAGGDYPDYSLPGTALASIVSTGLIPAQWTLAHAADPDIKFIVMDGGGNDVLLGAPQCLGDGAETDAICQEVVTAATEAGRQMQATMKAEGVRQAIYFYYPHVPAGGHDILDWALPMAQSVCESMNDATYHCTFVDTREHFNDTLIGADGIHPNAQGMEVLADLIWDTMKEQCMGQPASSGCCMP